MKLFSTLLQIDDCEHEYHVCTLEGSDLIVFKPINIPDDCAPVIFYAQKNDTDWDVLNVSNANIRKQALDEIHLHHL
ncbi:MAG TPA: hypothetical protein VF623_10815 [Segetibacter sp.]